MDIQELRGKTPDELNTKVAELKKEAFNLRFQQASGELSNTARIREVRRTIAQAQTLLNDEKSREGKVAPAKKTAKKADDKKKTAAKKPAAKKKAASA
jgi:large subunit ribosomal protein L29